MFFARRLAPFALVLATIVILVGGGGCEAIVNGDIPSFACDGAFDAGGVCPPGQRCLNATCVVCPNGDCTVNDCEKIDNDKDGYALCGHPNDAGTAIVGADCDDNDPTVHPGAPEVCNGKDNNCDGAIDQPCPSGQTCAFDLKKCRDGGCTKGSCTPPLVCDTGTAQCENQNTPLGGTCIGQLECGGGAICGLYQVLTTDVLGSRTGLCTRACCTSSDCPTDFACVDLGTGGNYCLAKTELGRPDLGNAGGGIACTSDADCRSGICNSNLCQDTCCSNAQCAAGTVCRGMDLQGKDGTTHFALGCATSNGSVTTGNNCENGALLFPTGPCASGICDGNNTCRAPCCSSNSSACTGKCGDTTAHGHSETLVACLGGAPGTKQLGQSCTSDSDCAGSDCIQDPGSTAKYCSDTCCTDTDCQSAGLVCRPHGFTDSHYYLRCIHAPVASVTASNP